MSNELRLRKLTARDCQDRDIARLRRNLLDWFSRHRRDLPWRRNITPYRVLVSEIMLQQTVMSAVAPRFERWMQRFPDLGALARASERDVLREWEGLGYYARARNLRLTAQIVRREHGGRLPAEYAALRKLPGIGDYTASAILSLVHDQPYPVLDANVRRVMMRYRERETWNRAVERETRAFLGAAIAPATRERSTRGSWNLARSCAGRARRSASRAPWRRTAALARRGERRRSRRSESAR